MGGGLAGRHAPGTKLSEQFFGGVNLIELLAKDPRDFLEIVSPGHIYTKSEEARRHTPNMSPFHPGDSAGVRSGRI